MTTINQYRVYCTTDSKYVLIWAKEDPTTCPENNTHSIDIDSVTIIDKLTQNTVSIKEEEIPTGGHFKLDMFKIIAPKNQESKQYFDFDYPINVISSKLITGSEHKGDILTWAVAPNTTIGTLTSDYTAIPWVLQNYEVDDVIWYKSDNCNYGRLYKCILDTVNNELPTNTTYWTKQLFELNVTPSVVNSVKIGYFITLTDGVNSDDIGYVTNINKLTNILTVNGASEHSYLAGTPTNIQMTIYFTDHIEIGYPMDITVASDKIGSSYVPTNTKIMSIYKNKSIDTDKELVVYFEYLY